MLTGVEPQRRHAMPFERRGTDSHSAASTTAAPLDVLSTQGSLRIVRREKGGFAAGADSSRRSRRDRAVACHTPDVDALEIDGSTGEGGGQILRSALSLACITGREIDVVRIRAGRPRPGLAAQHVAAVRAAAALCDAGVRGASLGSRRLRFAPRCAVESGEYAFDVSAERRGGSAGSTSLVLQTVALPLALATGDSRVTIRGGTHTAWSPPYDYLEKVWAATLEGMGIVVRPRLDAVGWYPEGGGKIAAQIRGRSRSGGDGSRPAPIELAEVAGEQRVHGRAITSRLPDHVGRRMIENARQRLEEAGLEATLEVERVEARGPGAGIFLTLSSGPGSVHAQQAAVRAGFSALGERGKLAEVVAEEAVRKLLAHRASGAPVDVHLGDQLALPAALAKGTSRYRVAEVSRHLTSNLWVVERFGVAACEVGETGRGTGLVVVRPRSDGVG